MFPHKNGADNNPNPNHVIHNIKTIPTIELHIYQFGKILNPKSKSLLYPLMKNKSFISEFWKSHQGRILRRRRRVSLFTYIFSISFKGRLDPSGWLINFQPPPFPRFPCGPSFSTMIFHPSADRLRLYLWHFTSPAICTEARPHHYEVLAKDYWEKL